MSDPMQKFIDQFDLTPGMLFAFDHFIYANGAKLLGRTSGYWNVKEVNGVFMLLLGDGDKTRSIGDRVEFHNPIMGDNTMTDRVTASAAFTLMVVNWFWNMHSESMSDETNEAFEKVYFGLKDAGYDKTSGINSREFYNITD